MATLQHQVKKLTLLILGGALFVFTFQNCSKGFQSVSLDNASLGSNNSSPPPDPTGTENWVVGNIVFTEGNVGPYDLTTTLPGTVSQSPQGSFAVENGALPECFKDSQGRAISPSMAFDGKIYNHCPADTSVADVVFSYEE